MASSSRRDDESSAFPAKAPNFFKIVLDSALRDGTLEIPQVVVMKHENFLADSVFLTVPSGAVWEIELESCSGTVWLQKGWPEFTKFYSLKHGYFVMFSYEGDYSCFQVRIFHRNNLEIDYPLNSSHDEEPNLFGRFQLPEMEELGDDVSVEILGSPPLRPQKMIRTNSNEKGEVKFNPSGGQKSHGSPSSSKKYGGGGTAMISSQAPCKTAKRNNASSRSQAFLTASSFKSDNPFLVVNIQPSYLKSYLRFRLSFVKEHISAKGARNMTLQTLEGKIWPVKCSIERYDTHFGRYRNKKYARVYDGWRAFMEDNHLKVGDACVFELINKVPKVTFRVGIYRVEDED